MSPAKGVFGACEVILEDAIGPFVYPVEESYQIGVVEKKCKLLQFMALYKEIWNPWISKMITFHILNMKSCRPNGSIEALGSSELR